MVENLDQWKIGISENPGKKAGKLSMIVEIVILTRIRLTAR
jgi:hypothetical protein